MDNLDNLIARHILGTLSEAEAEKLHAWRARSPRNEETFKILTAYVHRKQLHRQYEKPLFKDYIKVQMAVEEALNDRENNLQVHKSAPVHHRYGLWLWASAACVAFVLFFAFKTDFFSVSQEVGDSEMASVQWEERTVPHGQKLSLTLADGTSIKLNSGSSIAFPSRFGNGPRVVRLQGEAFFDVQRDTLRPFIVESDKVKTTVLGTSFNVRAYPEDTRVQVAVVEGRVSVEKQAAAGGSAVLLLPDEMAVYNTFSGDMKKSGFDRDNILGWLEQKIVFRNASFQEIVKELEKWYGVKFVVNREIKMAKGYNGEFTGQSLENVLKSMGYSIGFSWSFTENNSTIIIN